MDSRGSPDRVAMHRQHPVEVAAGTEAPAGTRKDDYVGRVVAVNVAENPAEFAVEGLVDRVSGVGPVDRDGQNRTVAADF
jgi:hypothetical protein